MGGQNNPREPPHRQCRDHRRGRSAAELRAAARVRDPSERRRPSNGGGDFLAAFGRRHRPNAAPADVLGRVVRRFGGSLRCPLVNQLWGGGRRLVQLRRTSLMPPRECLLPTHSGHSCAQFKLRHHLPLGRVDFTEQFRVCRARANTKMEKSRDSPLGDDEHEAWEIVWERS